MKRLLTSLVALFLFAPLHAQPAPRVTTSLNGEWTFHRDGSKETKTVTLPTHWETHEGLKFDGIGWYEMTIELPELKPGRRLLLHFDAVATHATVYWNDKKLGEHLGAWTPFRFDVTEHLSPTPSKGEGLGVRGSDSKRKHTIRVRVDEKVGHNTQGFLPIIAPHFGGIWQGVRLIEYDELHFDSSDTGLVNDSGTIVIRSHFVCGDVSVEWRTRKDQNWKCIELKQNRLKMMQATPLKPNQGTSIHFPLEAANEEAEKCKASGSNRQYPDNLVSIVFTPYNTSPWSPDSPDVIEVRILDRIGNNKDVLCTFKTAHRTITARGDQFLLNGQPLSIRGVLNWGYYPPSLAPTPTEEQWRADIKLIKSWGFNLMKCCLWVPPKRLLEIADEEGILIWLEYPTWHPKLTPQYQAELMQEYKEFHELDRNHPSVILRSLTCETGPGADIKVIQALYDQCKKMSGGLVVDDSSWIEWNRVFDFYDDHPYGNNHTWVATLDRLKKYIATSKYGVKPLCLGEAIAADTWVPTKPMLDAIAKAKADPKQAWSLDERGYPFWVPGFFDANQKWLERMGKVCGGPVDEEKLYQDSLKYAWLMRKYQMETYRREVPNGGYTVSVLRDFPLASMGLVDFLGQPKWKQDDWKWHGDQMILFRLKNDRRGYYSNIHLQTGGNYDDHLEYEVYLSNFGSTTIHSVKPGVVEKIRSESNRILAGDNVSKENDTPLATEPQLRNRLEIEHVFRGPNEKPTPTFGEYDTINKCLKSKSVFFDDDEHLRRQSIVVTGALDQQLLKLIDSGMKVLVVPTGKPGSFPLRSHWFLRGAPFVNHRSSFFTERRWYLSELVNLQHFDFASDVIPDVNYLEEIDPILMLWDNHDIKEVKTHGLIFETRIGKGRLMVSAIKRREGFPANRILFDELIHHLDSSPPPRNALKPETITRMRAKLSEKKLDLATKSWQFQPDGKNEGLKLSWEKPGFDDQAWKPIKIGQHWEGQGYNALDGWAWYRLTVDIPKDWKEVPIFWNTEGVDDAYELYVNGTKIGSGGDIPNKKTAFEDRTAHAIPAGLFKPGEKNVIAVRVYDWYGAGGIHRPMSLSNVPIGGVDILK